MNRRDWLAGLVVGAWAGFLLVYGPVLGLLLVLMCAISAAMARSMSAIGGLLLGAGVILLVIIALANANCTGLFAHEDDACTPPDLTGFVIAGSAMVLLGGAFTERSIRR
jgi:hypothetical protein